VQVYKERGKVVQEVIDHFQHSGRQLPSPRTRPRRPRLCQRAQCRVRS
jgi:hypothetical protein